MTLVPPSSRVTASLPSGVVQPLVRSGQTWYYSPTVSGLSGALLTEAKLVATPIWLPESVTIDRIGVNVTVGGTVGAVIRFGLYRDSGYGYPGALLVDAGTVAATTSGDKEASLSQAIDTAGLYWMVCAAQGTPATPAQVRIATSLPSPLQTSFTTSPSASVVGGYSVAGVTAALPTPFGTAPLTSEVASLPRMYVRVT